MFIEVKSVEFTDRMPALEITAPVETSLSTWLFVYKVKTVTLPTTHEITRCVQTRNMKSILLQYGKYISRQRGLKGIIKGTYKKYKLPVTLFKMQILKEQIPETCKAKSNR